MISEWNRYSLQGLEKGDEPDKTGKLFLNSVGNLRDLSKVHILGNYIDTIRQLFTGRLDLDAVGQLKGHIEEHQEIIELPVGNGAFHLATMGKRSGYQYKLQSNEQGIIIFVKSWYSEEDAEGAHLKVELSPHFLHANSHQETWWKLEEIANHFLTIPKPSGCAVHLAADIQGWKVPEDFQALFVTRSRAVQEYNGISKMEFASLSDVSVQYQRGLTLMFGKSTALQTCLYDKTDEVIKSDKEDYWRERWSKHPEFQEGVEVKRLEFRFHHQVVKELGQSQEEEWTAFPAILPHLDHLWRYASRNNRLMWRPGSQFLDPVWQLLHQDVHIEEAKEVKEITLARKKKQSPGAVGKNIAQVIGNLISIMARDSSTNVDSIMIELKLMSIWDEVLLWYRLRGMEEGHIRQQCEKALALRRLLGKAA